MFLALSVSNSPIKKKSFKAALKGKDISAIRKTMEPVEGSGVKSSQTMYSVITLNPLKIILKGNPPFARKETLNLPKFIQLGFCYVIRRHSHTTFLVNDRL